MNSVPWWKLKEVGYFVDLPLYRERTNIAGTQLLTGQAEIPGGQPEQISRLASGSSGMSGICEALMPPHCSLEMDVSRVPHSLAHSEPVIYSWNLKGLFRPWEERGLVTKYAMEGGQAGGILAEGVLCILGPREVAAPAVLIAVQYDRR